MGSCRRRGNSCKADKKYDETSQSEPEDGRSKLAEPVELREEGNRENDDK